MGNNRSTILCPGPVSANGLVAPAKLTINFGSRNRPNKIAAAAVFGVPDDYYGEELMAWVRLRAGEASSDEE